MTTQWLKFGIILLGVVVLLGTPLAAASSQQTPDELRKEITEELKGTTGIVTCTWKEEAGAKPTLTCGKKILISGDKIGVINIIGLPTDESAQVWVNAVDNKSSDGHDLSYDSTDTDHRPSIVAEIHKNRILAPSYGGIFGFRSNAEIMRKKETEHSKAANNKGNFIATEDIAVKRKLSIVLTSSVQEIEVGVGVGKGIDKFRSQSDQIEVVYERWGFETGGFIAVSNLADSELVTIPDPNNKSQVKVLKVRKADKSAQETGIFLSLIPRNYPYLGLGLGLATGSGRNTSIYLGPSIRLMGLGNRGLASFSAGLIDRQVKVFPGAAANQSYAQDSTVLKGSFESRLGGYFLINLGFTFGQIGTTGDSGDSGAK